MKTHDELKEIFENNFNCYSNTIDESIVLAMDCEQFIKVVSKILALGKPEPLAKNKQNIEIDDRTFQFDVNCLTHEEQLRFKLLLNKGVIVKVLE